MRCSAIRMAPVPEFLQRKAELPNRPLMWELFNCGLPLQSLPLLYCFSCQVLRWGTCTRVCLVLFLSKTGIGGGWWFIPGDVLGQIPEDSNFRREGEDLHTWPHPEAPAPQHINRRVGTPALSYYCKAQPTSQPLQWLCSVPCCHSWGCFCAWLCAFLLPCLQVIMTPAWSLIQSPPATTWESALRWPGALVRT